MSTSLAKQVGWQAHIITPVSGYVSGPPEHQPVWAGA